MIIPGVIAGGYRNSGGGGPTDPDFANVVSLLHFDGADGSTTFTDQIGARVWTPFNGAQIDTAYSAFGGSSGLFPATSDVIGCSSHADLLFGTGLVTVEGFFRPTGSGNDKFYLVKGVNSGGCFMVAIGTGGIRWRAAGTTDLVASISLSSSVLTFIALVRDASNVRRIYSGPVGGTAVQVASDTLNYNATDASTLYMGAASGGGIISGPFLYTGSIEEHRMTKSVCRYPGGTSFAVPTAPFPNS